MAYEIEDIPVVVQPRQRMENNVFTEMKVGQSVRAKEGTSPASAKQKAYGLSKKFAPKKFRAGEVDGVLRIGRVE
jgi:hypothetical protein